MQQHQAMNGRVQRFQILNVPKVTPPATDEFKYGFPSGGLEVVSQKWWESSGNKDPPSGNGGKVDQEKEGKTEKSAEDGADLMPADGEKQETDPQDQETGSLLLVRKEAKEEGRKALRLSVYRGGYGMNNLGTRERRILCRIFGSSLPSQWSSGSSES